MVKTCAKCGESYKATTKYFHKNKQSSDGLHSYCKECRKKERKEYHERRGKELSRRRYREDPFYQVMLNLRERGYPSLTREGIERKLREYLIYESKTEEIYKCGYCERPITRDGITGRKRDMHIDHLVPYSIYKHIDEEIDTNLDNLVVTCQFCNRSKSDLLFTEWYLEQVIVREDILDKYNEIENEIFRRIYENLGGRNGI